LCDCESELLCNYVMHVHHMLHFRLQKETMTLNMDPRVERILLLFGVGR